VRFDYTEKYFTKKYISVDFDKLIVCSKKEGKEEKNYDLNDFQLESVGSMPIDFGNKHFELVCEFI
jgi:hypothetical protein